MSDAMASDMGDAGLGSPKPGETFPPNVFDGSGTDNLARYGVPVKQYEWRDGWWWSGALGVDWRDWGFGFHVGYKASRNVGADFQIGPVYGYGCFEYGSEAFEGGRRAGLGVGPV